MDISLALYEQTILAVGYVAALMFLQILVVDVLGISQKHVPGTPVEASHKSSLFRASRTVANINESIGVFLCAIVFCLFSGATPEYTAYAAWGYALSRTLFAVCYYANIQTLRSICFGVSLLFLAALIVLGATA